MLDNDFDLDALLDDIAVEVSDLASENAYDKHDRLRQAYEDARVRSEAAETAMTQVETSIRDELCPGMYVPYLYQRLVAPEAREGRSDHQIRRGWALDAVLQGRDVFLDSVPVESVHRLAEAYTALKRAETALDEAQRSYNDARANLDPVEDCYVKFHDPVYDSAYGGVRDYIVGYGVITKITAASYIVEIDHTNSDRRMQDKATARIATKNAFDNVYSRGRDLTLLWGPRGNALRAERARIAAIKRAEEESRRRAAIERMTAICSAYDAAKRADEERTREIRSAPERAAIEATQRILAKYADEVKAEADNVLAGILAAMPEYTRPSMLDAAPPSRTWSDYLEEE